MSPVTRIYCTQQLPLNVRGNAFDTSRLFDARALSSSSLVWQSVTFCDLSDKQVSCDRSSFKCIEAHQNGPLF